MQNDKFSSGLFLYQKFIENRFRSIIEQLQWHKKTGNIKLICLKMLVVAVWIAVWMYAK